MMKFALAAGCVGLAMLVLASCSDPNPRMATATLRDVPGTSRPATTRAVTGPATSVSTRPATTRAATRPVTTAPARPAATAPARQPTGLDLLDPAKIPATQRSEESPRELVAVLGTRPPEPPRGMSPDEQVRWLMNRLEVPVRCVAFARGGMVLVSGSDDGRVRLWDVLTQRELAAVESGGTRVLALSLSGDGKVLAAATQHVLRLWRMEETRLTELATIPQAAASVALSADGSRLVAGCLDRQVRLWRISRNANEAPRESPALARHDEHGPMVALAPDGKILASGAHAEVRLWNVGDEQPVQGGVFKTPVPARYASGNWETGIPSLAISPDGKWLAAGLWNGDVQLWRVAGDRADKSQESVLLFADPPRHLQGFSGAYAVAFSPDGRKVAVGTMHGRVTVWDLSGERPREHVRLSNYGGTTWCVAFAPDSRHVAVGNQNGTIDLFRLAETGSK